MKQQFIPFNQQVAQKYLNYLLDWYKIEVKDISAGSNGRAWNKARKIKIPRPTDLDKFCVALHEIGHIARGATKSKMTLYKSEYLAETFALEHCEYAGFDPSPYLPRARGYVIMNIAKGYLRGLDLDTLDPKIVEWCQYDFTQWKGKYVFVRSWGKGGLVVDISQHDKLTLPEINTLLAKKNLFAFRSEYDDSSYGSYIVAKEEDRNKVMRIFGETFESMSDVVDYYGLSRQQLIESEVTL